MAHATEAHIAAADTRPGAAAAINQFGDPQAVADAFAGELATVYARRTIAWVHRHRTSGRHLVAAPSPPLAHRPHRTRRHPVLPLIALAIATAAGTFATTGRLMRWLPKPAHSAPWSPPPPIGTPCIIGDVTMITMFAVSAAPASPLAVIAVAASLTRIACSIIVIRTATQMQRRSQAP